MPVKKMLRTTWKKLGRVLLGLLLAVPGILLAVGAKPLRLGEGARCGGFLLALLGPIVFYVHAANQPRGSAGALRGSEQENLSG